MSGELAGGWPGCAVPGEPWRGGGPSRWRARAQGRGCVSCELHGPGAGCVYRERRAGPMRRLVCRRGTWHKAALTEPSRRLARPGPAWPGSSESSSTETQALAVGASGAAVPGLPGTRISRIGSGPVWPARKSRAGRRVPRSAGLGPGPLRGVTAPSHGAGGCSSPRLGRSRNGGAALSRVVGPGRVRVGLARDGPRGSRRALGSRAPRAGGAAPSRAAGNRYAAAGRRSALPPSCRPRPLHPARPPGPCPRRDVVDGERDQPP